MVNDINAAKPIVLIPTLNEEKTIEGVLAALITDDPIAGTCPVIVADGGSTDGTQAIVERLAQTWPNLRLVHNPGKTQAAAMNMLLGPEYEAYDIAIRCDAHAGYPTGFVAGLVACLQEKEMASVVIPMDAVADSDGCFQRGLVWVADTKLGAGGSPHRGGQKSFEVDHGHHAAFRLSDYRLLGGYDTTFIANEDAEYDARLRARGGRIWLSADHRIDYYPRKTPGGLWKQYWRYGVGRAQTCIKHSIRPALRQLIPFLHVILLALSLVALPFLGWIALAWPIFYLALVLWVGLALVLKHRSICGLTAALALAIMHTAWGLGFLTRLFTYKRPTS